jgi:hypothetical protein
MAIILLDQLQQVFVVLGLTAITLFNFYFLPYFRKFILKKNILFNKIFFLIYAFIFLTFISLFYIIDVGVFNEFKIIIISPFFLFTLLLIIIEGFGYYKLSKREMFKAINFLALFFVFLSISAFTATGIYFPAEDHKPEYSAFNKEFLFNNFTYNVTLQVDVETSSYHGFFIKSPLSVTIYAGYVRFNEGYLSENSTVELKINFKPYPYNKRTDQEMSTFTLLNTTLNKDKNNTYDVIPKGPWIIGYSYSGSKEITSILLLDGIEVATVLEKEIVYIEKGHVKIQYDFTRATYILTIWIIFLAVCPLYEKILNWRINKNLSKFLDNDYI